ncbi:MAG: hypothetical protein ACRDUY_01025 [Nitriliruptorales bacterium]
MLELDERTPRVFALLVGAPDEGHASVYGHLLRRNQRAAAGLPPNPVSTPPGDVAAADET